MKGYLLKLFVIMMLTLPVSTVIGCKDESNSNVPVVTDVTVNPSQIDVPKGGDNSTGTNKSKYVIFLDF